MNALSQFPINKDQTCPQRRTVMLAMLMTIISLIGFIWPNMLYPGEGQADAYRVNDLVNILIGLPGVLLSIWLIKRGKLLGLLFLPGAALYIFYTYIAYLFGITFSGWSIVWGVLVVFSGMLFFRLMLNLNAVVVKNQLNGRVPAIFTGIVLAVFGTAFAGLAFDILSTSPLSLPHPDLGLALADIVVSLVWLTGGVLLLFKKPAGFAWGLGMLYAGVLLFVGVILLVIVRPLMSSLPFLVEDLVVLSSMALVCFVPFGLFVRGVIKKENE